MKFRSGSTLLYWLLPCWRPLVETRADSIKGCLIILLARLAEMVKTFRFAASLHFAKESPLTVFWSLALAACFIHGSVTTMLKVEVAVSQQLHWGSAPPVSGIVNGPNTRFSGLHVPLDATALKGSHVHGSVQPGMHRRPSSGVLA